VNLEMKSYRKIIHLIVVISFITLLIAPTFSGAADVNLSPALSTTIERDYWPTDGWLNSTPEEQGMDSTKLIEMMENVDDQYYDLHSVVIARHGRIVFEEYPDHRYDADQIHRLYSATKSVLSALIGIAIQEGFIESTDVRVIDFFPDYTFANMTPQKERMTLWHLLTMTSGVEWDEWSVPYEHPENSIGLMWQSGDPIQYFLDLPMANEPGENWIYNSGGSLLMSYIINETTGLLPLDFAIEYLFEPLGITSHHWITDLNGIHSGSGELFLTPRDMTKFGYLFLNNGTWADEQIVPAGWVTGSTNTTLIQDEADEHRGYGLHWWTRPTVGAYYASGRFGQHIFVVPEYDLVVTFTGGIPDGDVYPGFLLLYQYILPSIMSEMSTSPLGIAPLIITLIALVVPITCAGLYWKRLTSTACGFA